MTVGSIVNKLKDSKVSKALSVGMLTASVGAMSALTCFAEGDESSVSTYAQAQNALSTGFGTLADNLVGFILMAIPIALGVFGIAFAINYAFKFFTRITRKM